jgi:hypothetical protein
MSRAENRGGLAVTDHVVHLDGVFRHELEISAPGGAELFGRRDVPVSVHERVVVGAEAHDPAPSCGSIGFT